MLISD